MAMGLDLLNHPVPPRGDAALMMQAARAGNGGGQPDADKAAAIEFEAVFLSQMMKEMFAGASTKSQFGGGFGEDMFRELLADEYAREIARSGGIGLAGHVQRELLALQEMNAK